ncbi:MAG: phosphoribosyl-AMP cyclohydrolase [Gemmatimonadaceae bacterium]
MSTGLNLELVRFVHENETVVVVAQDAASGRVLMVANADREALERTIETGEMHYRSRTRGLWRKGATSGNVQKVISLTLDCDGDAVVARVQPAGPACHTGAASCFDDSAAAPTIWSALAATISRRNANLTGEVNTTTDPLSRRSLSYTRQLLGDRNLRLKKIGEESGELIVACADGHAARCTEEAADLIYHVAVCLETVGSSLDGVAKVLLKRHASGA